MSTTLLRIAADLQLSLAAAVTVGQTTATLSSASDSDGVALPSGKYGFTVDGDTSAKEYIVCDLVGTALTGIQNISRQGAATTGFANYHRFGATVTITDWAILDRMLNNLTGETGFDSAQALSYDGAVAGLTGNQIPTVNYVLSVVNGGAVTFDQQVISNQTAGENLTAENLVYFKESDQKWWKVDADTTATFDGVKLGIALATVSADATTSIAISGPVSMTGLTAGSKYYASTTAGAITVTAPTNEVFVGVALSTTSLLLTPNPRFTSLIGLGNPSTSAPFISSNLGGNVQVFTSSGTWTKPTGARLVEVFVIGAGGGGGGGGLSGNPTGGGGGGGGGGYSYGIFVAGATSATETVTVGAGGAGGASSTIGVAGGASSFGTLLTTTGGGAGGAGTTSGGAAGTAGTGGTFLGAITGSAGGAGTTAANGAAGGSVTTFTPTGGGGGGGHNTATAYTGGAGGARSGARTDAGGTAGAVAGGAGGAGTSGTVGGNVGGTGGGGGGSRIGGVSAGGAGGAAGIYGGGGGGGGGAETGAPGGGAGGAGGNGIVLVITY